MSLLERIAAVAVAGATLYFAGVVNAIVIYEPSPLGALAVVIGIAAALALITRALWRTAEPDPLPPAGRSRRWLMRGAWACVSLMALVSLAWLYGVPRQRGFDWTPYHNDAIALNECAARLILDGGRPYSELDLFACYGERGLGPDRTTPLRRGLFADLTSYPSDDQLDTAWDLRAQGGDNVEFVWRPSYPALSFGLILPWVAAGWDTNLLYMLCLFAAMALVLLRAPPALRPWLLTGLLGSTCLVAFTIGGSADLLYALPLAAAWLWRERGWSAVVYGISAATKQIAWFVAPFLFLQWLTAFGPREALRRSLIALATFAVVNLPLAGPDPGGWLAGVLTPVVEPMFPRGAGIVFLGINGVGPVLPGLAYLGAEMVAYVVALAVAWRERRRSPELGIALAVLPLFLAHRSLFSYFFLLPMFALAGLARRTTPVRRAERLISEGALTVFAAPSAGHR